MICKWNKMIEWNTQRHSTTLSNYLESFTKFVRHDVVKKWIDASWYKEQDAWNVIDAERQILINGSMFNISENNSLNVKRTPAKEKSYDNDNWKKKLIE